MTSPHDLGEFKLAVVQEVLVGILCDFSHNKVAQIQIVLGFVLWRLHFRLL